MSITEIENPDLKPEHTISSELGYRFEENNFSGKICVFNRSSENSIDWIKEDENVIWKLANIDKIETNGLKVELKQHFRSFFQSYALG